MTFHVTRHIDCPEITFTQFITTDGFAQNKNLAVELFNNFYDFRDCYKKHEGGLKFVADPTCLVISMPLILLVKNFRHFQKNGLKNVGKLHGIFFVKKRNDDMITEIMNHTCTNNCGEIVYVFKSRSKSRGSMPVQFFNVIRPLISGHSAKNIEKNVHESHESRGAMQETNEGLQDVNENSQQIGEPASADGDDETAHLRPPDEQLKLNLISEWENIMDSEKICVVVCSVCGIRERKAKTVVVDGLSVDLSLLRNDELQDVLRPRSYNFTAYERAILNPKGLEKRECIGKMVMCEPCAGSLRHGLMPKFALSNWLYYGRDNLPDDIATEFSELSVFERMLIARARCNSVCCKFNTSDDKKKSDNLSSYRKGIRGNVMVAPLDAIRLYNVLPPGIHDQRDTMSAVIVANKMPSRETISKLGPVLVRKSRIQKLLAFLLRYNPHYQESDDLRFSQSNLDDIHGSDDVPDIPRTVVLGQLRPEHAMEDVNADYTTRNDVDFIESERMDELVMENVGFTQGDESPEAYRAMKLLALERCLSGKPFLASGTGNRLIPDFKNPSILTWLFPHLDPWGVGGFEEPRRRIRLSMKEQLGHLLRSDDRCFEEDPEFAFAFYNVIRKAEVSRSVRFQVPTNEQGRIIRELTKVDAKELGRLRQKLEKDPRYRASDQSEKDIMKLMKSITMTTRSLPGSNGHKLKMRDQIKAMINAKGSPTLFITINPSDVDHPIVRLFAGKDINLDDILRGEDMKAWERKIFAAQNPAASALFFDFMIRAFVQVILGHGTGRRGLFGFCDAYYGTVEAQGRGTLHCHMLIWLHGHLPPQILRDRLTSSEAYRKLFVTWLEAIIMNEFPVLGQKREEDPERSKRIRCTELGEPHPGTAGGPSLTKGNHGSLEEFWTAYKEHLIRLLNEYSWHEHTATCYKYVKRGQEKGDTTCRMRMDGNIYPETLIDEDTGYLQLRRLHPWIASYSDLTTFLMKCNVHVQFIGSGDAARAFIYYVTDYVTKAGLPLHAGLAAVSYVIKKTNNQRETDKKTSTEFCTAAMTKIVNAMMGRQEISHQQVMSYLVGGGDHYTSENFSNLYLGAFLRHLSACLRENDPVTNEKEFEAENHVVETEEAIFLTIQKDEVSINNQVFDYCFRPVSESYNSMCLYDFVAKTTKNRPKKKETPINSSDAFSSPSHPQRATHKLSMRSKPVLPIILGPSIPNRNASAVAKSFWAKYMLLLFKPWREAIDLKTPEESWSEAYESFESGVLGSRHHKIIENMCLLSECRDASFRMPRHTFATEDPSGSKDGEVDIAANDRSMLNGTEENIQEWKQYFSSDVFRLFEDTLQDSTLLGESETNGASEVLENTLGKQVANALNACLQRTSTSTIIEDHEISEKYPASIHTEDIDRHHAIMTLKRKRRLDSEDLQETPVRRKRRINPATSPFANISVLPPHDVTLSVAFHATVQEVVTEMNLNTNKEQLEAFLTVARHVGSAPSEQLLMFVSGVGGTGKSHVIKSIVKLFERTNQRKRLLLGAPTGSAAILIGGCTLHSLILESVNGTGKKNLELLTAIWKDVKYLIVDEISMLGARFLSKLSTSMCQAKGDDEVKSRTIFGGVNVIFMGDLCQLKPPRQHALYASDLTKMLPFEEPRYEERVSAMNGMVLWRQVTKVIELVRNCRHASDPRYSEFLSRLRVGMCISGNSSPDGTDDYNYLQSRLLSRIQQDNPAELTTFSDAPVIVGSKFLRDILNARLVIFQAGCLKKAVHIYYSKDYCKRTRVPPTSSEYLWSLQSSHVRDSFGRLPLFEGMKVMVTENIAFDSKVVNGTEGIIRRIIYDEDEEGRRYATVVYLYVEGIGFSIPGLEDDVVPIFPVKTRIENSDLQTIGLKSNAFTRFQLPLIPAYAYTDFKSQGKTLTKAIVDIVTARGQGAYVMLSRVTSLSGVAILRWFPPSKIYTRLSDELRDELTRLKCHL